jgi:hypothetical protein
LHLKAAVFKAEVLAVLHKEPNKQDKCYVKKAHMVTY